MPSANVELVAHLYELWNDGTPGRLREAARLLDPQFEYVNPPDAVEPGTVQGTGGFARVRETFRESRVEVDRYLEVGDEVVAIIRVRARPESGPEVDFAGADVWTVTDGKAMRLRWFTQAEQALEAVGLPGQTGPR